MSDTDNTIIVRAYGDIYEVRDPILLPDRGEIEALEFRNLTSPPYSTWQGPGVFMDAEVLTPWTVAEVVFEQEVDALAEAFAVGPITHASVASVDPVLADALQEDGLFDEDAFQDSSVTIDLTDLARVLFGEPDSVPCDCPPGYCADEDDAVEYDEEPLDSKTELALATLNVLFDIAADPAEGTADRIDAAATLVDAINRDAEIVASLILG